MLQLIRKFIIPVLLLLYSLPAFGQTTGGLQGTVTLGQGGEPIHNVLVTILQLKRTVGTDETASIVFRTYRRGDMTFWRI